MHGRAPTRQPLALLTVGCAAISTGIALRLLHLGSTSFTHAEVANLTGWRATPLAGGHESLSFFQRSLASAARSLAFDEFSLRLPGAVIGCLSVALLFVATRRSLGIRAAVVSAVGLALSAFQVSSSRQFSSSAMASFAAVAVLVLFLRLFDTQVRRRVWLNFFVASAFCAWLVPGAVCLFAAFSVATLAMEIGGLRLGWRRQFLLVGILVFGVGLNASTVGLLSPVAFLSAAWTWSDILTFGGTIGSPLEAAVLAFLICFGVFAARVRVRGGVVLCWIATSIVASISARHYGHSAEPYLHAVEPGLWIVAGVGAASLCDAAAAILGESAPVAIDLAIVTAIVVAALPSAMSALRTGEPDWRKITEIVRRNWRTGEPVVVVHDRDAFLFYAPDFNDRVEPVSVPARGIAAFGSADHGWFVAPSAARLYLGWGIAEDYLNRFGAVDLSPNRTTANLYYVGKAGPDDLLRQAEFFDLPAESLIQGSLLFEILRRPGSSAPALWKADQVALSPPEAALRNQDLLNAVYLLAARKEGDRSGSLAYRLASAFPDWAEARSALASFH